MQETQETRLDLWVGKVPWSRAWQPTPGFLPGESQDRRAWQAAAHGVGKSQTRLSGHADTLFCVLVVVWKDHIWGFFKLPNSKIPEISLFSGRNRKRGERGRGRWGSKVALWYHINLKKGWCFTAEPVIHNGDPDSAMLGTWRFSVWLYSSRLPSTNWRIVIIFSISKRIYSIWNSGDRHRQFPKDDRLQCNYCLTQKHLSRSQNLLAWRDLRDTLVNPLGFWKPWWRSSRDMPCVREGPVSQGECQWPWPPVWCSLHLPRFLCYIMMSEFSPNM